MELLDRLIEDGSMLGLTTGNVEEAAHIKLARANLNRYFSFGGYGSDSSDRVELTKVALKRGDLVSGHTLDLAAASPAGTHRATSRRVTARVSAWSASPPANTRPRSLSRPGPTRSSIRS